MMAFARIEPFGSDIEDRRFGMIASMLANIHRDPQRAPEPFDDLDLVYWNDRHREPVRVAAEDVLLDDPERMSALMEALLFGQAPDA